MSRCRLRALRDTFYPRFPVHRRPVEDRRRTHAPHGLQSPDRHPRRATSMYFVHRGVAIQPSPGPATRTFPGFRSSKRTAQRLRLATWAILPTESLPSRLPCVAAPPLRTRSRCRNRLALSGIKLVEKSNRSSRDGKLGSWLFIREASVFDFLRTRRRWVLARYVVRRARPMSLFCMTNLFLNSSALVPLALFKPVSL